MFWGTSFASQARCIFKWLVLIPHVRAVAWRECQSWTPCEPNNENTCTWRRGRSNGLVSFSEWQCQEKTATEFCSDFEPQKWIDNASLSTNETQFQTIRMREKNSAFTLSQVHLVQNCHHNSFLILNPHFQLFGQKKAKNCLWKPFRNPPSQWVHIFHPSFGENKMIKQPQSALGKQNGELSSSKCRKRWDANWLMDPSHICCHWCIDCLLWAEPHETGFVACADVSHCHTA